MTEARTEGTTGGTTGGIQLTLPDAEPTAVLDAALERLVREDALGQLLERRGRLRELATEGGDVKLDWVDGVELALEHPERLAAVEAEAAELLRAGVRRVIWAGMGGSVQTVYALQRTGCFAGAFASVHPLDSTDPASLNRLLRELAALEGLDLDAGGRPALRRLLAATAMVGVSMGMTSEEPITHLEWFDGLLAEAGLPDPGAHIQVMTLPGSYLDDFARARGSRMVPIQLDGASHTPGRMSAPATRVFLRPLALRLVGDALRRDPAAQPDGRRLARVLARAQALGGVPRRLAAAERAALTRRDAFVRLGAYLAGAAAAGRNKLLALLPAGREGFAPWLEQLIEESLGKGGRGLLLFYDQDPAACRRFGDDVLPLAVRLGGAEHPLAAELRRAGRAVLTLDVPADGPDGAGWPGELAALCLGFERLVAVYGYLQGIVFAGQPAVEAYKRYARELREAPGPVPFPADSSHQARLGGLTLYYSSLVAPAPLSAGAAVGRLRPAELAAAARELGADPADAAGALAAVVALARRAGWLRYLDLTFNGELSPAARAVLEAGRRELSRRLGLPVKLRTGPSDYHSTEQSETDGPPELISLRLVALEHEGVLAGCYSDKFLLAQARGTWQAMEDAGRWVLLATLPRLDGAGLAEIERLLVGAAARL